MKKLFLLLSLITFTGVINADDVYMTTGKVYRNVVVSDTTGQYYALKLFPSGLANIGKDQVVNIEIKNADKNVKSYVENFDLMSIQKELAQKPNPDISNKALISIATTKTRINPDGERASIHLTPFITGGKFESSGLNNSYDYKTKFGFSAEIKIPVAANVTISPFYTRDVYSYDYSFRNVANGRTESLTQSDSRFKVGATISLYP